MTGLADLAGCQVAIHLNIVNVEHRLSNIECKTGNVYVIFGQSGWRIDIFGKTTSDSNAMEREWKNNLLLMT